MSSKIILGLILLIALISVVLVACMGMRRNKVEMFAIPPFTIKRVNTYGSRYDINTARRVDNSRSYYKLLYQDQLVSFPSELNENSGVPGLWKIYQLNDAPQPALLAASQTVYLITEENNAAKVYPLIEKSSDFARLQWLDSENGAPGPEQKIYSSNDTEQSFELDGGRYLMVNKRVVLDVSDLSLYPFEAYRKDLNYYSAYQVLSLSPDQDKMVCMGHRSYDRVDYYALLIYHFKEDKAEMIPFDRTELRLHEPYEYSPDWFDTYFEWVDNNGKYKLEMRQLAQAPNWEGHFGKSGGYSVSPVKRDMLEILVEFAQEYLVLPDSTIQKDSYSDHRYEIRLDQNRLGMSFFEDLQSVYFSPDLLDKNEAESLKIVRKVGDAFNEHLKEGAHQDLFTRY